MTTRLAKNHPLGRLGLDWQLTEFHGWGVFGLNLALSLIQNGHQAPQLLREPNLDPSKFPSLTPILDEFTQNQAHYKQLTTRLNHPELSILHAFGNDFVAINDKHWGKKNIGFIFFEDTLFSPQGLERAHALDLVLTGSRWNAEILSKMGLKKVAYVMQGIDPKNFANITPHKTTDKFVIFTGGKLEFRKGQDIVLAAYKEFYKKHPDSLLVTAWNNPWPKITENLSQSCYGFGAPKIVNNKLDIAEWCRRSGLPDEAFHHLGFVPNNRMPEVYAQADVALFPNRAEGGTNLVAMEVMATGVPCILSANTGHLDLIAKDNVYPLINQRRYTNPQFSDWGESTVEEILEKLEYVYTNRNQAQNIGANGKEFIHQFTWHDQAKKLIDLCANLY
jgi:glycosyltransferase involved in cell wall biosynthesis